MSNSYKESLNEDKEIYSRIIHNDVKMFCKHWSCNFVYNDSDIRFQSQLDGREVKQGEEIIKNIEYFNEVYRKPLPPFSCINGEIM